MIYTKLSEIVGLVTATRLDVDDLWLIACDDFDEDLLNVMSCQDK
jgi:hypothetical protein